MDFEKYKNKLEHPKMIKLQCPNCGSKFIQKDKFCCECGQEVRFYYNSLIEIYNADKNKYYKESNRLYELFKHDALDDVGLLDHPKADDIFNFAWDHGHSSGYNDVYYWLTELADLFED